MTEKEQAPDIKRMIALESELERLRQENGISARRPFWIKMIDRVISAIPEPKKVNRDRYLKLAICCGWFCGAHRFYSGHKCQALCYLLLCWTGIPLAMTIIDVLQVLLKSSPDEDGQIEL